MLFIIIVYVTVTMYDPSDPFIMSGLLAVGLAFIYMAWNAWHSVDISEEGLTSTPDQIPFTAHKSLQNVGGDVVNSSDGNMQFDDQSYASTGVAVSRDFGVIPVSQLQRDYNIPNSDADNPDEMDNADVVTRFITGGADTYVPEESSSQSYYKVYDLAYPKHPGHEMGAGSDLLYGQSVPLNENAINNDDKLSRGQMHRSQMNKRAIDGAVRATRNQFEKYFGNELDENEKREWWSHQADDVETDYQYYY
jgi:hypothetical protein